MSMLKTTLATLILVTLTGCGSGGGNGGSNGPSSQANHQPNNPMVPAPSAGNQNNTHQAGNNSSNSHASHQQNNPITPSPSAGANESEQDRQLRELRVQVAAQAEERKMTILGKTYAKGLTRNPIVENELGKSGSSIYNQNYSLLQVNYVEKNNQGVNTPSNIGIYTEFNKLPAAGVFTYKGVAINMTEQGELTYQIDLNSKKGHGSVSGLSVGNVSLESADLSNPDNNNRGSLFGSAKSASGEGMYHLDLFGPQAEEISGNMILNENSKNYGLAGSRE